MTFTSINPSNGKLLETFAVMSDEQCEAMLAQAQSYFEIWRHKSYQERALVIGRAADLLNSKSAELACLATLGMGKRISEARAEVEFSSRILAYYAKNAETFLAPLKLHPVMGSAYVESSPIGLIFCIEPWNFPYYQLARIAGPHLMAGNVLLVKPSSLVPQCALAFEKILREAGAPQGLYSTLLISHDQTDRVIDDQRIRGVALTGSVDAGKSVAARAGQNVKISSMELGGNDAFIILEDADLEHTIKWAVWGRMYNAGQTCVAAKRFIVVESLADQFLDKFKKAFADLKIGDPIEETTTLGPLSSEAALSQIMAQVERALGEGAKLIMGGKRLDRPGYYFEPTILGNIKPGSSAFSEEFFGPVALFFSVKDEEEAVTLANDSQFGLGGAVFTTDVARGKRVASRINTGMMFINNMDWSDAELPFGGIKESGYGRELGSSGIQQFVNKKLIRHTVMDAPA